MTSDQPDRIGDLDHEVVIIGAGVCGIYQLHRLLQADIDVTVLEAGDGPGGTWYWNRYPGARFDSESYTYGFSFSPDLLDEWDWSEHFAAQPETLAYLEHVVDRFDLARHMQFGCRVERLTWHEHDRCWLVETSDDRTLRCRFLLTAVGLLSAPTLPDIEGRDDFTGTSFHTFFWPEDLDLTGKRVGIIGTGATAVQIIPEIAPIVDRLTVFQRRPNWCAPLHNSPIDDDEMSRIRASYDDIFRRCSETPGGFLHGPVETKYADTTAEERQALWEDLYASPGFGIWLGNFRETLMQEGPNDELTAFIADKIRARVHDPDVAEKLIPKDHGFGIQRVPMETNYYEAYNRDNVRLVDLTESPIERVVPDGIRTTTELHELDVVIYATGFDAITGAFDRIDVVGTDGQKLREKWIGTPLTYLGLFVSGFPNLITIAGPTTGSASTNYPRGIEMCVDWTSQLIDHLRTEGITRFEATAEAEAAWTEHVREMYGFLLLRKAKSWFTGYNSNVEGRDTVRYMIYNGGNPKYRERLQAVADAGYEGLVLEHPPDL